MSNPSSPEQRCGQISEAAWSRRPATLDGTLSSSLNAGMLPRREPTQPSTSSLLMKPVGVWSLAAFLAVVISAFAYLLLQ